jgi:hypothetical protein
MSAFERSGLASNYLDEGDPSGWPFVFQHGLGGEVSQPAGIFPPLRRLMCNELDQQVRQMTQRSAEGVVDPLCAGVGHNLGSQTRQQPS